MASMELELFIERMRTQINLSWEKEEDCLKALGLKDGISVLEAGSGPGLVSEKLLGRYPNMDLTLVEINRQLAQWSKELLTGKFGGRVHIVEADIMNAGLADCKFDIVIARLVFQHLPDPIGCAKEMFRMLKPGGRLIIEDIDEGLWGIIEPFADELTHGSKQTSEQVKSRGGDRSIGRKLWRILRSAGFEGVNVQTLYIHSDEMGVAPFFLQSDQGMAEKFVENHLIAREEMDRIRDAYERFVQSDYPYAATILFIASGEKHIND